MEDSVPIPASATRILSGWIPVYSALALAWCLIGCQSGPALDRSVVNTIRDGQTTRTEIDKIFGEPMQLTKSPDGRLLYKYQRFYGPDHSGPPSSGIAAPRRDEANLILLSVLFTPGGIVEKHVYSKTQPEISRTLRRTGQRFAPDDLEKIVPQKSTRADLVKWFGPFWSEELTLSGQRLVVWLYADAYNLSGGTEVQTLEVIIDDADTIQSFRVTKRDPWKN